MNLKIGCRAKQSSIIHSFISFFLCDGALIKAHLSYKFRHAAHLILLNCDNDVSALIRACARQSWIYCTDCRGAKCVGQLAVLPDVHADGVRQGDVGVWGPHGGAGIPHVEEEENGDRREAEDGEEGQGEDVGQEHELRRGENRLKKKDK